MVVSFSIGIGCSKVFSNKIKFEFENKLNTKFAFDFEKISLEFEISLMIFIYGI